MSEAIKSLDPTIQPILEQDTGSPPLPEVPEFEVIPVEGCLSSSNVLGF